jgi:hypothetical protein
LPSLVEHFDKAIAPPAANIIRRAGAKVRIVEVVGVAIVTAPSQPAPSAQTEWCGHPQR